ncbi:MAG: thermonuclease family protein [Actinomycetes bacterium]
MRTKKFWAGLVLAMLALVATGCRSGIVTYVVDGDTIDVDGRRVRFIGIDTPERGQCGYGEAKLRVAQLVKGKRVDIVSVPGNTTDRYDRELGYVQLRGFDIGKVLLAEGLAKARYDSLDGYPFHPRQADYRLTDARTPNRCP